MRYLHDTKGKVLEEYLEIRGENDYRGSGIYAIVNKSNNKIYVGQSSNIRLRWRNHLTDLRKNTHRSTYLNHSINKYGLRNFYFTVLENCKIEELDKREKYWIEKYKVDYSEFGYNKTVKQAEYEKHYDNLEINFRQEPDYWWLNERDEQYQKYKNKVKNVIRLYREGKEMDEIASLMGVSSVERIVYNQATVHDRRCRINVYNRSRNLRKIQIQLLLAMKMTKTEVANRLGISLRGLNSYLTRKDIGYDSKIGKSKVSKFVYKPLTKSEINYYKYRYKEPYLIKRYIFNNPQLTAKQVALKFDRHRDYIGEFIFGEQHDEILPELNDVVKNRERIIDLRNYRRIIQLYRSGYPNSRMMDELSLIHLSTLISLLKRTITEHDKRCRLNSINRANKRNRRIFRMFAADLTIKEIIKKFNISEHQIRKARKGIWCLDINDIDDINKKSLPINLLSIEYKF